MFIMLRLALTAVLGFSMSPVLAQQANDDSKSSAAKPPLTQGISSVSKNLKDKPDNKGLQNAAERLQENQDRIETRRAEAAERGHAGGTERSERSTRPERSSGGGRSGR